jgi:hypothetical protein
MSDANHNPTSSSYYLFSLSFLIIVSLLLVVTDSEPPFSLPTLL